MTTADETVASAPRTGFHDGELLVQRQAGVAGEARRLERMLDLPDLSGGAQRFLADRTFAVLTGRDASGRLWTSPLRGPAGFLRAAGRSLRISAAPGGADPLYGLLAGQHVGLVAIEFSARRRVRVNGCLVATDADWLEIEVDQAYGNCPQYISRRTFIADDSAAADTVAAERAEQLTPEDRLLIGSADTFFLGTAHPTSGVDASHRGGPAGFVHVDGAQVWWADLPGNNMFNSLGNLATDPAASLVFVDWAGGTVLALSGTAVVEWLDGSNADVEGGTGRQVRFTTEAVVRWRDSGLRAVAS